MSVDTRGKIKGFVRHEDILAFIKQNWDAEARYDVTKETHCLLRDLSFAYVLNEHSENTKYWYTVSGFISFTYNGHPRNLFYHYHNINTHENLDRYSRFGLTSMVYAETTSLTLGCWDESVEIITEIVKHFGGGWIDDNDCDDKEFYEVIGEKNEASENGGRLTRNELLKELKYWHEHYLPCDIVVASVFANAYKAIEEHKDLLNAYAKTTSDLAFKARQDMTSITRFVRLEKDSPKYDEYKELAEQAVRNILESLNNNPDLVEIERYNHKHNVKENFYG